MDIRLLRVNGYQERFLPAAAPILPGFDVAGRVHPAEFAAGDYFDYLPIGNGQVGVVIGDVAGHGFGPALIMASTHVMLRLLVESHWDVAEILTLANSVLVKETEEDRFVTLLLACLDPGTSGQGIDEPNSRKAARGESRHADFSADFSGFCRGFASLAKHLQSVTAAGRRDVRGRRGNAGGQRVRGWAGSTRVGPHTRQGSRTARTAMGD